MTLDEAIALVGTAWKKDGKQVTFIGIRCLPTYTDMLTVADGELDGWGCIEYWEGWLSDATALGDVEVSIPR